MLQVFNNRKKKNKYKCKKGFTNIVISPFKTLVSKKPHFLKLICQVKHLLFVEENSFDETTFKGIKSLMEQEIMALDFREGRYPRGEKQDVAVLKVTFENATKVDVLSEDRETSGDDSGDGETPEDENMAA